VNQRRKSQSIGLLMIVILSAVLLGALAAVVWPVPVVYAGDPPEILTITVTSSLETYFHDPGLDPTGGTVYFNNVEDEGAWQVLTVTTIVVGSMPMTLTGAPAFGMPPMPDTTDTGELGITYTISISADTEDGVPFTVTDSSGLTNTAVITFTRDNFDPTIISPTLNEFSLFLHADGPMLYYSDGAAVFWVEGEAQDDEAGLYQATYSDAFESSPLPDDLTQSHSWEGYYAVALEREYGNGTITVTVSDQVGNSATQIFTYTRDITSPTLSGPFTIVKDSLYLHANETTVYYSHQMGDELQSFTVQGATEIDGGAGLYRATFSPALGSSPGYDYTPDEWSGTYDDVEDTDWGNGTITVTVYDNVSNWSEQTFNYVEDTTAPTVELNNVTNPGYDPNGDELDDDGSNWYNAGDFTGGNWEFSSNTSDDGAGRASCSASWDHSNDTYDDTTGCTLDGAGSFSGVNNDPDGTVTVMVTILDNVGNSANDTVVFNIDNTKPEITSTYINENSDYLYRADDLITVYYGDDEAMNPAQVFTVNGSSSDTGVGLKRAVFSEAFNNIPVPEYEPSTWSRGYYPDSQDRGSGTITVTVYDHLDNAAYENFYYIRDTEPPTVVVNCPALSSQPSWSVDWSGSWDPPPASDLNHFDVQYREESGGWQDWLMDTSLTEATFGPTFPVPVQDDTTYYFQVRAEDNVSNEQQYTNCETTYRSGVKKVFLPIVMAPDSNWGFETGNFTSWQHGGQLAQSVSTAMPHSGSYSALLGSPSYACNSVPVGSAWLRRSVTVPSSGSPTLSFWYRIYTQDRNSILSDEYDLFAVYINGSDLVVKDANITYPFGCSTTHNLGWNYASFPLDAYKGQTIQITFYNYNRAPNGAQWYNTYTYVDDVSVQ